MTLVVGPFFYPSANPYHIHEKMNKVPLWLIIWICFILASCLRQDEGNFDTNEILVEEYVALLKSGNYALTKMPVFEIRDIPELLKHVRDEQKITNYPFAPYAPAQPPAVEVGFVVLWTIEGTRLDTDYPSMYPLVSDCTTRNTFAALEEVVVIYEKWWEESKGKSHAELIKTLPLAETGLCWN